MENLAQHAPSIAAIAGGGLIGLAIAVMWLATGREAAVTESLDSLASGRWRRWQVAFVLAIVAGGGIAAWLVDGFAAEGVVRTAVLSEDVRLLAAGAFLVGAGIRIAAGGLAAHGIFGIARLSPRSLVAVATLVCAAIAVATATGAGA